MLLKIAFTLESFSTNITNMESFRWFLYEIDYYENSTIANTVVIQNLLKIIMKWRCYLMTKLFVGMYLGNTNCPVSTFFTSIRLFSFMSPFVLSERPHVSKNSSTAITLIRLEV